LLNFQLPAANWFTRPTIRSCTRSASVALIELEEFTSAATKDKSVKLIIPIEWSLINKASVAVTPPHGAFELTFKE